MPWRDIFRHYSNKNAENRVIYSKKYIDNAFASKYTILVHANAFFCVYNFPKTTNNKKEVKKNANI